MIKDAGLTFSCLSLLLDRIGHGFFKTDCGLPENNQPKKPNGIAIPAIDIQYNKHCTTQLMSRQQFFRIYNDGFVSFCFIQTNNENDVLFFNMASRNGAKAFWKVCINHHVFFR